MARAPIGYVCRVGTYRLRTGRRELAVREANTAREALLDYVRSLGCADEEIRSLGPDAVSWRGAVYRAAPDARTPDRREGGRAG